MEQMNNQNGTAPLNSGQEEQGSKSFAFDRMNYILISIGMSVVIIGFLLMSGSGSNEEMFNPEIFSTLRIKVAPAVTFAGYIFIIYGIMHRSKYNLKR